MKKFGLLFSIFVIVSQLSWGQTSFTATYNLAGGGNDVTSFAYNGTTYAEITPTALLKVGITSSSSTGNYRGSNWPLDPNPIGDLDGTVDLAKYIGFSISAVAGYKFTVTSITFGVGRSATGPRQWQWRGNADSFGSIIDNYTTLNAGLTNSLGVLTNPDANSSWTGNVLTLSTSYSDLTTSAEFRLYGFNSEATGGTGGLQGNLTIEGTFEFTTSAPTISVSPTSLSGFTYVAGSGPSTSQSYNLSGTDLTGFPDNITVTCLTNYEVSTDNSTFSGSVSVPYTSAILSTTPVYVRLKTGLSAGPYNGEIISNAGGGAITQNVTLNGSVTSASIISVTPTTLTGFTYVLGSGPSASQSYVLSGTSLDGSDVTITAPTNYEISINDADWFTSRTLTAYDGTNTNIYVRLKANRSVGNYNNEIISNAGGGATTVNVTCNGSVTGVPLPVIEDFNYTNSTNLTDNSWIAHNAAGTNPITVTSPGLTYEGYASSGIGNAVLLDNTGEDVSKLFGIESSGVIYYSFLVNVTTGTEGYFIHLGNSATAFAARVYVKPSSTTGKINFGISNTSTASYATTPTDFDLLTTYLVIVKYNVSTTGEASLWVLSSGVPASELAAGIPEHTTSGTGIATIERICLRQYIVTQNIIVDGIRVATEWTQAPLPVELTSFSASVVGNAVKLNWRTETEVNNYGFDVERKVGSLQSTVSNYEKVGFVNGNGNSNSPKSYSFEDKNVTAGKYSYRLKQIDNDGQFEYSKSIEVDFGAPKKFELSQNYPNPFNPITTISFNLPEAGNVKLTVFNILGQELKTLVNEFKESGVHTINFDASELNSGMYIYKIEAGTFVQTRKMTLVK